MSGPSHQKEQRDRLAALLNDKALIRKDTFASRASAEADLENVGRHAKASTVVGAAPTVDYFVRPNWSQGPQPPTEPPLGFSVEDHEAVGEKFEIEASLSTPNFSGSPTAPACGWRHRYTARCRVRLSYRPTRRRLP